MRKTKKLLSIILCITTLFCAVPATFMVNAEASITIKVTASEKKYDGTPIEPQYTVEGSVTSGDTLEVTLSATSIVNAGTEEVTVEDYKVMRGDLEVTSYYDGLIATEPANITISKRDIMLESASSSRKYDGSALESTNVQVTGDGFVGNEGFETLEATGTITDAGSVTNEISYILNSDTLESNYNITTTEGTLEVIKRDITLTSGSSSKVFDELPLTNNNVDVTGDDFIAGEGATYDVTGSQTEAGSSKNTFTYLLNEGTSEDNYNIETVEGDLTVNPGYALKAGTADNGTITLVGEKTYYESGDDVEVTITPENANYNTKEVFYMIGEQKISITTHNGNNYSFKMPASDITIQAVFEHKNAPTFATYVNQKVADLEDYSQKGDSQKVNSYIKNKKAEMKAVKYDGTKSLEDNEAIIDTMLSEAKAAIDSQRNIDTFDAYKVDRNSVLNNSKQSGDSDATIAIIDNAVNSISALQYDSSKSMKDNKAVIDDIVNLALENQKTQREKDTSDNFDGNSFYDGLGGFLKVLLFPLNWFVNIFSKFFKKYF